uniref:Uncharacterized protein n=1 Tax=Parascaris equorum TaxID=6256 RepID=A0A914RRF4_PAREQ
METRRCTPTLSSRPYIRTTTLFQYTHSSQYKWWRKVINKNAKSKGSQISINEYDDPISEWHNDAYKIVEKRAT